MNHPDLRQTIITMMAFHDGQIDKSGVPYFYHPLRVMMRLGENATAAERHAALLHDTIEDCGVTPAILADLGYARDVIEIVELVSRIDKSVTYRQFIGQIAASGNVQAIRVKLADLTDNMSEVRLEHAATDKVHGIKAMINERYLPAYMFLNGVLDELGGEPVSQEEIDVEIEGVTDGKE